MHSSTLPSKPSQRKHAYTVNGLNIKTSDEKKYFGITLTSDIPLGKYVSNICCKALKKLGFTTRVVERYSDEKVKETFLLGIN
jgi:hypothetical protein